MEPSQVWQLGYDHGYGAASGSGTAEAPNGGWDSWAIEAVGVHAFCEDVLGLPLPGDGAVEEHWTWQTEERMALCREYAAGAQAGADAAVAETASA